MSSTSMSRSLDRIRAPLHRSPWKRTVGRAAVAGFTAGMTSAVTLAICGRLDGTTAAGPLNGPSQWIWGREGARRRRWSWRETAAGFVIHQLSSFWWALLHEFLLAPQPRKRHNVVSTVARAGSTGALAYTVDYHLTPRRLEPGFDAQLRRGSLLAVYVAFAAGLAIVDIMADRQRLDHRARSPLPLTRPRRRPPK